jgi:hypothetical protein
MAKTQLSYEERLNRLIHERNMAMADAWDKGDMERYFEISNLSYCKGDEYTVGTIVKSKDGKLGKIVKTWKYYESDTMSFGYMVDGGWIKNAKCDIEAVTEAEKAEYFKEEAERKAEQEKEAEEKARKREKQENVNKLFDYVKDNGEYPEHPEDSFIIVGGEVIFNDFTIYGGGREIKIDNDKIWAIRNNGADGDDWSYNNIHTGGAGAIGYVMEIDDICSKYINKIKSYGGNKHD